MKKTYEKPILIKLGKLSHVTAQEIPSEPEPQAE
ncbi:putative RiPP precursor [Mesorhizobium sp. YC-39]|nr:MULTISPECIES: putative RiPP precursor [unclassified Mesorhizobium]MCV3208253.1 putative RiPP precursor [Mesorhizobium sp. YC-2]MCV3232397.1 putative RiPP precursor [Mesorhizobium sp. YC-39]